MEKTTDIQAFDVPISNHFVGTYPAESDRAALAAMLTEENKDLLYSLSNGETDQPDWVIHQIESYRTNPAFRLVKDGDWSGYVDKCPQFEITPGHTLTSEDIGLRYHEFANESWSAFDEARNRMERPDLKYQIGIPTGFDMSLFTLGEKRGMDEAAIDAFTKATVEQIEAIHNEPYGKDVIYQLETPASLSIALAVPDAAYRRGLALRIVDLVSRAPEGAHFGIHLCVGDLNNEARQQPADRTASVELANAIAEPQHWKRHSLDYVHEPIAAGHDVPKMDEEMYEGLQDLRLPHGTRYIAGMVHEGQDITDQRVVLEMIKARLPEEQRFGIAAACGLGRRSPLDAEIVVNRMVQLSRA